jgi:hypothetical protein
MSNENTGARYEIAINGTPRTYRDTEKIAIEAATHLKTRRPQSENNGPRRDDWQGHAGHAFAVPLKESPKTLLQCQRGREPP